VSPTILSVGPDGHRTIGAALRAAKAGDVIEVAPGTYREAVEIKVPVELRATEGTGTVRIEHARFGAALDLRASATVRGITIARRKEAFSPAVEVSGKRATPLLEDCVISAPKGRAIDVHDGATLTIRGCRIEESDYALNLLRATCHIERCDLRPDQGGLEVDEGGRLVMVDTTLAGSEHDAIEVSGRGANVDLLRCEIAGGHAHTALAVSDHATARLTDCRITGSEFSAVHIRERGIVTMTGCRIEDTLGDGIIVDRGRCEIRKSVLRNTAREAISVWTAASLVAEDLDIEEPQAAGVALDDCEARLVRCRITGARGDDGVVVHFGGKISFEDCAVTGSADTGFNLHRYAATLTRCQARDNGGPGFDGIDKATLTDCVSTGNGVPDAVAVQPVATATAAAAGTGAAPTVEQLLDELDALVGLVEVKAEVRTLIDIIKVGQRRAAAGLKSPPLSRHLVFTGNPGTGKTTVARLYGRILAALGLLQKGHLVEAARVNLVAEHVGGTAVKTLQVFNSARGGVLFIDEAYALSPVDSTRDFGREAIDTLVKLMEDHRDEVVVIVAGYTGEMARFIAANPGLESRFGRTIEFPDYSPLELVEITELQAAAHDYRLAEATRDELLLHYVRLRKGVAFGNGREARRTFEAMVAEHANRVAHHSAPTAEMLTVLTPEDLPDA
jgi:Holliday junction resolvasome RuvABC ATP-dependent DNA helicase subunit